MGKADHKHAFLIRRGRGLALALTLEPDQTGGSRPGSSEGPKSGTFTDVPAAPGLRTSTFLLRQAEVRFYCCIIVEQTRGHEKLCCSNQMNMCLSVGGGEAPPPEDWDLLFQSFGLQAVLV